MIVKKLAVPLVNDKILSQAEYCYIATAAISDAGFDFIRSRIPPKCKMEIITGLDVVTSPGVLKRIWKHYQERILLRIYTKNFFHANAYIFDLPYRKSVAFVGSGTFTLEGLKDHEEIFDKITDPKEIEALKSWFTGYYEFAEALTEEIINDYDLIYPTLKQNEIASRQEKKEMIELVSRGFSLDSIAFKNQYFKKEDYQIFSKANSTLNTPEVVEERKKINKKLLDLHEQIKRHLGGLKLQEDPERFLSTVNVSDYADQKIRSLSLTYGRREAELKKYEGATQKDFMTISITIQQKGITIALNKDINSGKYDREFFKDQMNQPEYKTRFFQLLTGLGQGYWIEIFGEHRDVTAWQHEDALWEFTRTDDWKYYRFAIGKNFLPGSREMGTENIAVSLEKELDKLVPLYEHLKQLPK
jgi:hypothetical protein